MKVLTKVEREQVRMMFGGKCAYCGVILGAKWHADHVEPLQRKTGMRINEETRRWETFCTGEAWAPENDRKDNFFPSCVPCNINKSCTPLDVWRACLERLAVSLRRDHGSFRHAERFGLVQVVDKPVVFYFET